MMETNKYIIEIPDNTAWLQWVKVSDKDGHVYFDFKDPEDLTPYIEPDLDAVKKEVHDKCMSEAEDLAYKLYSPKIDEAYQRGLNDAWDVARKIPLNVNEGGLSTNALTMIFGNKSIIQIFKELSASEVIEKIRQYEQEQEDAEFHVGDEFVTKNNKDFGVIVAVNAKRVLVLWKDDADIVDENNREFTIEWAKERFAKTGRNFPEIAKVFKKMQEVRE